MMKATIPTAIEKVRSLLIELGFKKRAGDIFTIELEKDVLGWVGLNRATQNRSPGEVEINPVIGVRQQEIERVVAELRGEKFHAYLPPTVNIPLGYLFDDARYRAWSFTGDADDGRAQEMVAAIATHGLAFMRSNMTLDAVCRSLDARTGFEHQLIYRRPVALVLSGDSEQAEQILNESLMALGNRTDIAASEFKRFCEAFRAQFCSSQQRIGRATEGITSLH